MDRTDEVEALRRRLYRPGATAEDRRRYAAAVPPAIAPTREVVPSRRRGHRVPVVLAAGAVVIACAGTAVAQATSHAEARPVAAAAPRATTSAAASAPSIVLAVSDASQHAQPVHGIGSATVALDTTAVSLSGGTLTVLLSSADERPLGWRAIRLQTRRDWSAYPQVLRESPARDRLGATRPDELDFTGGAPRWVQVQAPVDAAWELTVATGR